MRLTLARLAAALALFGCGTPRRPVDHPRPERRAYFDVQRRGANFFNRVETRARFRAAAARGIRLVRLVPDKWKGAGRDFLLGSADNFVALVPEDLARLRAVLDTAHAEGVRVVLGLLGLPGARWRQLNGDRSDFRLYREVRYQDQAVELWRQLARALAGHPAVVAYNPINEPHPERATDTAGFDLSAFYRRVVAAIRESDRDVAVVLDGGDFASPAGLARLTPIEGDPRVLYAFHFYIPWAYVNHASRGRYRYPGEIPVDDDSPETRRWDAGALSRALRPVVAWQRRHDIPSSRVFAAEFGCPRTHPGVERWIGDLIRIFNARGWHWAFYSFREDTWHAMDYELGPRAENRARGDNVIWRVIQAAFRPGAP
jgi:hypothetical protein